MNHIKTTIFVILVSFTLIGPGCPDTLPEIGLDPLSGNLVNSSGSGVNNVMVLSVLMDQSALKSNRIDSSQTDLNGFYMLPQGFPNDYINEHISSCGKNELKYQAMRDFMLLFVHPSYDSTVALFQRESTYYWLSDK